MHLNASPVLVLLLTVIRISEEEPLPCPNPELTLHHFPVICMGGMALRFPSLSHLSLQDYYTASY